MFVFLYIVSIGLLSFALHSIVDNGGDDFGTLFMLSKSLCGMFEVCTYAIYIFWAWLKKNYKCIDLSLLIV